ncbi:hypothetical protein ACQR3P_31850 [Rhodococcus sp. IEGM1300]
MSKFASYSRPATGLTGKPAGKQEVMTLRPVAETPPYNERLARERAKQTKQNEKDVAHNA